MQSKLCIKYFWLLPWFVHQIRNGSGLDVPVCNLFGNKCYEQTMLAANLKLSFTAFGQGSFFYEIICILVLILMY